MGRVIRVVLSGASVAELLNEAEKFIAEVKEQQNTPWDPVQITNPHISEQVAEEPQTEEVYIPNVGIVDKPVDSPLVTGGGVLDSRGLPWDERIHASSQGTNKDGSWRYRRGVEQAQIDQVEAELRGSVPAQPAAPMPPPVTASPVPPPVPLMPNVPAMPVHPVMPPMVTASPVIPGPSVLQQPHVAPPVSPLGNVQAPPASPAPAADVIPMVAPTAPSTVTSVPPMPPTMLAAHTPETFKANLVSILANLVKEGRLTQEYIRSLQNYFKVDNIWQVSDEQAVEMFNDFVKYNLIIKADV